MTSPDLQTCLANLEHDACYHVVKTLKSSEFETTELVVYEPNGLNESSDSNRSKGSRESNNSDKTNGSNDLNEPKQFIRKQIANQTNAGSAYELLYLAYKQGRVLECAPRVLECYDIPGYQVVILEYLEGVTLDRWVAQYGAGEQTTQLLFPKLCDAVMQLHAAFEPELIHRDIKPSNIMILADGSADEIMDPQVCLLDFGIARLFNEESDCDTHALGTRSYAPPEQFGFGQTDVRSDVYALGAVLYFMLTGATPQASFSSQEKRDVFLSAANPVLAQVIRKASAFDPQQRYQSVGELKAAFMKALSVMAKESSSASATSAPSGTSTPSCASASLDTSVPSDTSTPSTTSISGDGKQLAPGRIIIGVIWDVVIFLTLVLFIYGCIFSAVHPSESQVNIPALNLGVASTGLGIMFVGIALLLFDVGPLTPLVPQLKRYTITKRLIIGFSVAVGGFLIMFIALGLAAFV